MTRHRFDTRAAFAALTGTIIVCAAAVSIFGKPEPAQAFPPYKEKEGVNCAYCHTSPAGGKRNYRGKFYKKNGLSFAAFDDKAEADGAGEPIAAEADSKPKSLTPPAGTVVPATPAPATTPAPETPKPAGTSVAALRTKAAATAAALKAAPKNTAKKKVHSATLTALARGIMADATIRPVLKYPEALRLSRQAVTLDPANKDAASDVKQITDVYKQMGLPIPK